MAVSASIQEPNTLCHYLRFVNFQTCVYLRHRLGLCQVLGVSLSRIIMVGGGLGWAEGGHAMFRARG